MEHVEELIEESKLAPILEEAEKEANRVVEESKRKAAQIIAETRKELENYRKRRLEEIARELRLIEEKRLSEIEKEANAKIEEGDLVSKKILEKGKQNFEKGVKFLLDLVLGIEG